MGRIYEFLGLSVTSVKSSMTIMELKEAYSNQIIYVTAQKLCFDYLHDWSASSLNDMVILLSSLVKRKGLGAESFGFCNCG